MEQYNSLYHHGIMGMHWGIRRYQPYGHGGYDPKHEGKEIAKAAKLAKYKERETKKVNKFYEGGRRDQSLVRLQKNRNNYQNKYEKSMSKGFDVKATGYKSSVNAIDKSIKYNKALRDLELKKVSNMTYDQMSAEKKKVAKAVTSAVLLTVGSYALAGAVGSTAYIATTVNVGTVKSNNRISLDERKKLAKKYYK